MVKYFASEMYVYVISERLLNRCHIQVLKFVYSGFLEVTEEDLIFICNAKLTFSVSVCENCLHGFGFNFVICVQKVSVSFKFYFMW